MWISAAVFAVAVVATMPWGGGGLLRWERAGSREPARALAVVMVLGWLGITVWAGLHTWALPVALAQAVLLWLAAMLACWQTIREDMRLDEAASGVAALLFGVTFLLFGVSLLRSGNTLFGVAVVLGGVAFLVFGVDDLRGGKALVGWAFPLLGVAALPGGVAFLLAGDTLAGLVVLLLGVSGGLVASWLIRRGRRPQLGKTAFVVLFLLRLVLGLLGGVWGLVFGGVAAALREHPLRGGGPASRGGFPVGGSGTSPRCNPRRTWGRGCIASSSRLVAQGQVRTGARRSRRLC